MRLYVNGFLVGALAASFRANTAANLWLGAANNEGNPAFRWRGDIDSASLWNVVRTQNEIQAEYNSGLTGTEAGLVAYYDFNQGTAGGNNAGETTLLDRTANARNGTLTGFALMGTTSNWIARAAEPEINVTGNSVSIANGDTTPAATDHTDFGASITIGSSVTRTFTIENLGAATLNLTGTPRVTLSGSGDFSVTAQPSSPLMANGGSTTFSITFTPSAQGVRTAKVSISSEDCDEETYTFDIQGNGFGITPRLTAKVGDPAVCLEPGGLVGNEATLTNPNNTAQVSSWTATLPAGLTAVAGTCVANVPGTCTIAANGGSVSWNGTLPANTTVTIIYRTRVAAGAASGTQFCINNAGTVGGVAAALQFCFTLNCPLINARVSDQKAGSVLVFPYYTSTVGGASDTRLTISNVGTGTGNNFVHLFLIDGASCAQSDLFLCLTPNASFSFKASDYDPGNTGYVLAVAVNAQGLPMQNNVLIGNAFVNTPTVMGNYGAESFWANNALALATIEGGAATLYFDQVGYDAVPKQFAVEIQSPADAVGQQVVTAGLSGSLVTSQMTGAAQLGIGQAYNEKEAFASFSAWLTGTCQARATVSTVSPRVPNGLGNLIRTGQTGTLKFNVGGAVGLLLTPRTANWKGIRTLHKTQTTATTITIPISVPVC